MYQISDINVLDTIYYRRHHGGGDWTQRNRLRLMIHSHNSVG